jgi:hypothetical protein
MLKTSLGRNSEQGRQKGLHSIAVRGISFMASERCDGGQGENGKQSAECRPVDFGD